MAAAGGAAPAAALASAAAREVPAGMEADQLFEVLFFLPFPALLVAMQVRRLWLRLARRLLLSAHARQ
eukprot:gene169-16773_t